MQVNESSFVGELEAVLVRRAQTGDARSFERLYRKYSQRIFAVCKRFVRDDSIADDLVQETFMCAFRRLGTFRGESLFSTWLHRIAVNASLMYLRKTKIDPCAKSIDLKPTIEESHEEPKFLGVRDLRLTSAPNRIQLERAICLLPPGYRMIFILHDVEGYEHREIGEILGCSSGNTKSQLHKARKRLRELLGATNVNSDQQFQFHQT